MLLLHKSAQVNIAFRSGISRAMDAGKTGFEGSSCQVAASLEEGCNPSGILFPSQIRYDSSSKIVNLSQWTCSGIKCVVHVYNHHGHVI